MNALRTLAAVLLLTVVSLNAQTTKLNKVGIENLKNGIVSENTGLQKSAIYMAGKHQVEECVSSLLTVLDSDSENKVKVLAMKALLEIGNDESVKGVKDMLNSHNVEISKKAKVLYLSYYLNNAERIVSTEK